MTAPTTNSNRLFIHQLSKNSTGSSFSVRNSNSDAPLTTVKQLATTVPQLPPPSSSTEPTGVSSSHSLVKRTEVTGKSRLVVVRSISRGQNEEAPATNEIKEVSGSEAVQIPAALTDGNTSVYLIRRPIPPAEPQRETKLFQSLEEEQKAAAAAEANIGDDVEDLTSPTPSEDTVTSPSQVHSTLRRPKTSKHGSSFQRSGSPQVHSPVDAENGFTTDHSSDGNALGKSKRPISSSRGSQRNVHRSRSRHKILNLIRPDPKDQSAARQRSRSRRRVSPKSRSPSPLYHIQPSPKGNYRVLTIPGRDRYKNNNLERTDSSSSQTKNTGVQVDLPVHGRVENENETVRNTRPRVKRNTYRKRTAGPRLKSSRSIVLVNSEDQTVAVVENPYAKGETITPVIKHPRSSKKTRIQDRFEVQSTEQSVETSRCDACLNCLSKRMCLVITICCILILIGLVGVGVSAYFLGTDSSSSFIPKIVGVAIGGVLAVAALFFLCCVLVCINSRDGYYSSNNDAPRGTSKAFASKPPSHANGHPYANHNYVESYRNNYGPPVTSVSTVPSPPPPPPPITKIRQKPVINETNDPNSQNIIIEMPQRLLTGRKTSPRSQQRKINNVVNNIGRIVEDAKKRYNGDVPNKVIVKVDESAKPAT